ncbi:hypothetical protein FSARC_9175 [Fusarium sarcochroum]|uniref:Uncharacterized protein n=1 Tax=Fusarium sarcochroum TaxID=1208366 RepID=A0A8H4TRH7_9HYPO|nr:hypothetical protein FSARC_9175 [Fusarium sarcochroum]
MSDFTFYRYIPSLVAPAAISGAFGLSFCLHTYQCIRTKTKYMMPLLVGSICETVGFAARAVSASEAPNYSLGPYIIQSLLVLVAPVIIVASIYMFFGRIIRVTEGGSRSVIRERLLTVTFVCSDIFAFLVQSTGAGMMAKEDADAQEAGKYITVGGLILQLIMFGFFIVISVVWHVRIHRQPTPASHNALNLWRKHMLVLYVTSILVMIRSVFRLVEYLQGNDGYLLGSEIWLYVFDAALMLIVVIIFNLFHPSELTKTVKTSEKNWLSLIKRSISHPENDTCPTRDHPHDALSTEA